MVGMVFIDVSVAETAKKRFFSSKILAIRFRKSSLNGRGRPFYDVISRSVMIIAGSRVRRREPRVD